MDFNNILNFLPKSNGALSTIDYCLISFWFIVAVVLLIISLVKTVLAIWNIIEWESVGNSFLLFIILLVSSVILYVLFHSYLDTPIEGSILAQIVGIGAFILFLIANLTYPSN